MKTTNQQTVFSQAADEPPDRKTRNQQTVFSQAADEPPDSKTTNQQTAFSQAADEPPDRHSTSLVKLRRCFKIQMSSIKGLEAQDCIDYQHNIGGIGLENDIARGSDSARVV